MPDNLKSGIESLSGFSMDDVRVHYNSSKPATVQALAYTQGTDIHVAPGQEKHLPHEAWHVAQQMAGRVSPTTNINGMPVNDNAALEHEADVMGEKAVTQRYISHNNSHMQTSFNVAQRFVYRSYFGWPLKLETINNLYYSLDEDKESPLMLGGSIVDTELTTDPNDVQVSIDEINDILSKKEIVQHKDLSLKSVTKLVDLYSALAKGTDGSDPLTKKEESLDHRYKLKYDKSSHQLSSTKTTSDEDAIYCKIGDGSTEPTSSHIYMYDKENAHAEAKDCALNQRVSGYVGKGTYEDNIYDLEICESDGKVNGYGSILHISDQHVLAKKNGTSVIYRQPSHYHAIISEMEEITDDKYVPKKNAYDDAPKGNHYFINPFD